MYNPTLTSMMNGNSNEKGTSDKNNKNGNENYTTDKRGTIGSQLIYDEFSIQKLKGLKEILLSFQSDEIDSIRSQFYAELFTKSNDYSVTDMKITKNEFFYRVNCLFKLIKSI